MRNLGILVSASLVTFALACGSGGGSGTPAAGGSNGGGTGTTPTGGNSGGASGTTPTGGGNGSATCSLPSCLKYLAVDCVESGACTTQTDLNTTSYNTCYANGIKEIVVHDVSTDYRTMTVKKGSSTCFSTGFDGNAVYSGAGGIITVMDASGATVATARYDDNITFYYITCTGAAEVATDPSCLHVYPTSILTTSGCDEGGCTP